jgi:creatinine amidohydrolase
MSNKRPQFDKTTRVGRMKKKIYDASEKKIDAILKRYGIPSPGEMDKPGSYIQSTIRAVQEKKKEKNDLVIIPLGSTENHGPHCVSGQDIFQVTRLADALRRHTAREGKEVNLTWPPSMYGGHPKHHMGIWGTVPLSQKAFEEVIIDTMFGLWADGYRKQIILNNHGDHWMVTSALHKFAERYPELPILAVNVDWITAVGEFFHTKEDGGPLEEVTIHAGEFETSVALVLCPEMVEMKHAVDTKAWAYLPEGHFDKACNQYHRPINWYDHIGNVPLECVATPEGTIGSATKASVLKAKRAIAAILTYLEVLHNDILEKFPPGEIPPIEETTLFSKEEMEGYLKKPGEPGYKNPYRIWRPAS